MELIIYLKGGGIKFVTVTSVEVDMVKQEVTYWEIHENGFDILDGATINIDTISKISIYEEIVLED